MKDYDNIKKAMASVDKALGYLIFVPEQEYNFLKQSLDLCSQELFAKMCEMEDNMAGNALEGV